jgi:hypothetical protein
MEQVHLGLFDNETAVNLSEFETRVNNTLNDATNKTGKVCKSLDKITGSYDRRVGVKGRSSTYRRWFRV